MRPDGTGRSRVLITQIWFPQASAKVEARYEFHGDGTVARILLDGEGSPFDGGDNVAPLDRVDLYDAPDITSGPSTQLRAGERYDVALRPAGWLQVRLPGQKDAAALKWLRYVDLVIDRHGLAPSAQETLRRRTGRPAELKSFRRRLARGLAALAAFVALAALILAAVGCWRPPVPPTWPWCWAIRSRPTASPRHAWPRAWTAPMTATPPRNAASCSSAAAWTRPAPTKPP